MEVRKEINSASQVATNFDYIAPEVVALGSVQEVVSLSGPSGLNDGNTFAS